MTRYDVVGRAKGQDWHSNEFRYRNTGYPTKEQAETWAANLRKTGMGATVVARPTPATPSALHASLAPEGR